MIISINGSTDEKMKALETEIENEEKELKFNRQRLKGEKRIVTPVSPTDVIELNVDGEIISTTRQTLTKIPKSILSLLFNGRWEHRLPIDQHANIRLDFNPILFRYLLDQLQTFDPNNPIKILPPSQPSLVQPFKKMLRKLRLQHLLSSQMKQVLTFNVGGQIITNRQTTFTAISNSNSQRIIFPSTAINLPNGSDVFLDSHPKLFQHLIDRLRTESFTNISFMELTSNEERSSFNQMLIDLNNHRKLPEEEFPV